MIDFQTATEPHTLYIIHYTAIDLLGSVLQDVCNDECSNMRLMKNLRHIVAHTTLCFTILHAPRWTLCV